MSEVAIIKEQSLAEEARAALGQRNLILSG